MSHIHNPFYFYVERRGRSPVIPFCLGTAKGKTWKGCEGRGSWVPIPRVDILAMGVFLLPVEPLRALPKHSHGTCPSVLLRARAGPEQAGHHNG